MDRLKPDIHTIFDDAIQLATDAERARFLDQACGDDPQVRQRVDSLLRAHTEAGGFLNLTSVSSSTTVIHPVNERPGTTIGRYTLHDQIGEGGFGVVYRAEQTKPVKREVALKIIKPGMDTKEVINRFAVEQQALALMNHPHIARVIDAGATDAGATDAGATDAGATDAGATDAGRPYFVMELVEGIPITDYCDRQKLTTDERLKLFLQVCDAVQHAHQKGIIHRDLKPTNILVAEHDGKPVPKVIDFGVAKAISQRLTEQTIYTSAVQMIGTPLYMSPEQAEPGAIDIDTRSDIYSLGVLLYELLTGTTPFERDRFKSATYDEIRRVIREEDPPRPSARVSTLGARATTAAEHRKTDPRRLIIGLKKELDWIVMKALEKDRERRYESIADFAEDVERYLTHETVRACPPSWWYRVKKYARRNRGLLITATVLGVTLLTGTGVSVWQAIEATKARKLANDRLVLANERLANETEARAEANAERERANAQRELAEEQRRLAEANFQKALAAVDQMLTRVADETLAQIHDAEPVRKQLLEDALQFYEQFLEERGEDPALRFEVAKAWQRVGKIRHMLYQWQDAAKASENAIVTAETLLQDEPNRLEVLELIAESQAKRGLAYLYAGVLGEGAGVQEQGRTILYRALESYQQLEALVPNRTEHLRAIAAIQMALGEQQVKHQFDEGVKTLRDAVDTTRRLVAANPDDWGDRGRLIWSLILLGKPIAATDVVESNQLFEEAEALGAEAAEAANLPVPQGIYDDPMYAYASGFAYQADAQLRNDHGTSEEQEILLRRALDLLEPLVSAHPNSVHLLKGFNWCVSLYSDLGVSLVANGEAGDNEQNTAICRRIEETLDKYDGVNFEWYILKRRAEFRFHRGRYRDALADLNLALEKEPNDLSTLQWIPLSRVAACPDEDFRKGVLDLATRAIELVDDDRKADAYGTRALIHAAMGQWSAARADFAIATENEKASANVRYQYALLCLSQGHEQTYRDVCRQMLALAGDRDNAEDWHWAAWTCILAPNSSDDPALVVQLAQKAYERDPQNRFSQQQTLGFALFRAGRYPEAIHQFMELLEASKILERTSPSYTYFGLAMAHQKLGHTAEARRWLAEAVERADEERAGSPAWNRKLTLDLFQAEAQALIGPSYAKPPALPEN